MLGYSSPEISNLEHFQAAITGGEEAEEVVPAKVGYYFYILFIFFTVSADEAALKIYHTEDAIENYVLPTIWGEHSGYGGPCIYKLPLSEGLQVESATADVSMHVTGYYSKK